MTKEHKRQQQNSESNVIFDRLDALRVRRGTTWDVIAEELGISKSMIFHVKRGSRNLGKKALYRLEELERREEADSDTSQGEASKAECARQQVITKLEASRCRVTPKDIKRGYVDVELEYLAGRAGSPKAVRLSRPDVRETSRLLKEIADSRGDLGAVLLASLEKDFANDSFLNRLTPFCYQALEDAAARLAFGLDWMDSGTED